MYRMILFAFSLVLTLSSCDRSDSSEATTPPQDSSTAPSTKSLQRGRFRATTPFASTATTLKDSYVGRLGYGTVAIGPYWDISGTADAASKALEQQRAVSLDNKGLASPGIIEVLRAHDVPFGIRLESVREIPDTLAEIRNAQDLILDECLLDGDQLTQLLACLPALRYISVSNSTESGIILNGLLRALPKHPSSGKIALDLTTDGAWDPLPKEPNVQGLATKDLHLLVHSERETEETAFLKPLLKHFPNLSSFVLTGINKTPIPEVLGDWFSSDSFPKLSILDVAVPVSVAITIRKRFGGNLQNLSAYVRTQEDVRYLKDLLEDKIFVDITGMGSAAGIDTKAKNAILHACREIVMQKKLIENLSLKYIEDFSCADFDLLCQVCEGGVLSLTNCSFRECDAEDFDDVSLARLSLINCTGVAALAPILGNSSSVETLDLQLLVVDDIEALAKMSFLHGVKYLNVISLRVGLGPLLRAVLVGSQIRAIDLSRCEDLRSLPTLDDDTKVNSGLVINVSANALTESSQKTAKRHGIKIVQRAFPIVR